MIQSHIGKVIFTASFDDHQPLHDWYAALPDSEAKRGIVEVYHKEGDSFTLYILCTGPFHAEFEAYSRTGGSTREKVLDFSAFQFARWIATQDVPQQVSLHGKTGKVLWSAAIAGENGGPRYDTAACRQIEENLAVAERLLAASETPAASPERKTLDAAYPEWLSVVKGLSTGKITACIPEPFLGERTFALVREALMV